MDDRPRDAQGQFAPKGMLPPDREAIHAIYRRPLLERVRLISKKIRPSDLARMMRTFQFSDDGEFRGGLEQIVFASREDDKEPGGPSFGRIAATGIGAGLAGVGIANLPVLYSGLKIIGRRKAAEIASSLRRGDKKGVVADLFKRVADDPNFAGKIMSDYTDMAQAGLNKGLQGKIAGVVFRWAKKNPDHWLVKKLGGDGKVSHYAGFRSGPKGAVEQWANEVEEALRGKQAEGKKVARLEQAMRKGREAFQKEYDAAVGSGLNEAEAVRHVLRRTTNKDIRRWAGVLANQNQGAYPKYTKPALLSPALAVGGAGMIYGANRPRKEKNELSSSNHGVLMFGEPGENTLADNIKEVSPYFAGGIVGGMSGHAIADLIARRLTNRKIKQIRRDAERYISALNKAEERNEERRRAAYAKARRARKLAVEDPERARLIEEAGRERGLVKKRKDLLERSVRPGGRASKIVHGYMEKAKNIERAPYARIARHAGAIGGSLAGVGLIAGLLREREEP